MVLKAKVLARRSLLLVGHLLLEQRLLLLSPLPFLLHPLLLRRDGDLQLRVHGLDLGEVRVHEVAEQDLAVERAARVGKLDVRHAVDGALLDDGEAGPCVIDIGLERAQGWFGGERPLVFLLVA